MRPVRLGANLDRLRVELASGRGVRLGETTCVSRRLHTIDPSVPDTVQIICSADAGRVFYNRSREKEVVHLDIFHSLSEINHRAVARGIREAIGEYALRRGAFGESTDHIRQLIHYTDVQTGVGGGRISGSLNYGRKTELRRAHQNHVHVAILLPDEYLDLVCFIQAACEKEIQNQGQEIRKIERIVHLSGGGDTTLDISPYASVTDSLIKNPDAEDLSEQGQNYGRLQFLNELLNDLGDLDDVDRVLSAFKKSFVDPNAVPKLAREYDRIGEALSKLESGGYLEKSGLSYRLTERGKKLHDYIRQHARDIEAILRSQAKRRVSAPIRIVEKTSFASGVGDCWRNVGNEPRSLEKNEWVSNLAVTETAVNSLVRNLRERNCPIVRIAEQDIRVYERRKTNPVDICLLLDASASMAGSRISATVRLAEHLLSSRDRVAAIVFQGFGAELVVPFTRDKARLVSALRGIKPGGLTPLSQAIDQSVDYLARARTRNPLILLITDGVPTIASQAGNPVSEAIASAKEVAERGIPFTCVGLQPNKKVLEDIAREGKANLYIIEEIESDLLLDIALKERRFVRLDQQV